VGRVGRSSAPVVMFVVGVDREFLLHANRCGKKLNGARAREESCSSSWADERLNRRWRPTSKRRTGPFRGRAVMGERGRVAKPGFLRKVPRPPSWSFLFVSGKQEPGDRWVATLAPRIRAKGGRGHTGEKRIQWDSPPAKSTVFKVSSSRISKKNGFPCCPSAQKPVGFRAIHDIVETAIRWVSKSGNPRPNEPAAF